METGDQIQRIPMPSSRPSIHTLKNKNNPPSPIQTRSRTRKDEEDIIPESSLNSRKKLFGGNAQDNSTTSVTKKDKIHENETDQSSGSDLDDSSSLANEEGGFEDGEEHNEESVNISTDLSRRTSFRENKTESTPLKQNRKSHSRDLPTYSQYITDFWCKINSIMKNKIIICVLIPIVFAIGYSTYNGENPLPDINLVKEKFLTQDEDLWSAIESGVEDVIKRNQPRTFIFLYTQQSEKVLENLLEELSLFIVCSITNCGKEPIQISDKEMNSNRVLTDYGTVIEDYKDELKDRGLMIIRNLQNVRGLSAQAFHAICDEFTPLVDRAVIIFTMKVSELPPSTRRMKYVEEYFKNKWTEVKTDTLNALITRITSMVIEIKPPLNS